MVKNPDRFAETLQAALWTIKGRSGKKLEIIKDELGFALGRNGGSFINYLLRGHIPADPGDVVGLVSALQILDVEDHYCQRLWKYSGHPPGSIALSNSTATDADQKQAPFAMDAVKIMPAHVSELMPFVAGPPITHPRQFFGREYELRRIFGWWRRFPMSSVAVTGVRRSGKTSLLHYLRKIMYTPTAELRPDQKQDWLPQAQSYRWVWVDFQDVRMRKLERLLHHLLTSFDLPTPEPCTLDAFMDVVTDHAWEHPTIILMDELGAGLLAPELDQAFWMSLRSLVSLATQGKLAFLAAAHAPPAQLAEERGKTSPFFNMFTTLELGPFTESEVMLLIASSPLPFATADAIWISAESKRWPLFLQILCQERFDALEMGDTSDDWKARGLHRICRFQEDYGV